MSDSTEKDEKAWRELRKLGDFDYDLEEAKSIFLTRCAESAQEATAAENEILKRYKEALGSISLIAGGGQAGRIAADMAQRALAPEEES